MLQLECSKRVDGSASTFLPRLERSPRLGQQCTDRRLLLVQLFEHGVLGERLRGRLVPGDLLGGLLTSCLRIAQQDLELLLFRESALEHPGALGGSLVQLGGFGDEPRDVVGDAASLPLDLAQVTTEGIDFRLGRVAQRVDLLEPEDPFEDLAPLADRRAHEPCELTLREQYRGTERVEVEPEQLLDA